MTSQKTAQESPATPRQKGSSDTPYDLPPMAFAKWLGLRMPSDPTGALSYEGLLQLALDRYYDRNPHLARPRPRRRRAA